MPAAAPSLRLLYITSRDLDSGEDIISPASRVAIGMLSRDFTVSLAVVGELNTVGMNRLRIDLGPVRVAGGFEDSKADAKAPVGLRTYLREHHDTDMLNARLQSAIQRKADDCDVIVIDDLIGWAYRPASEEAPLVYLAREVASEGIAPRSGLLGSLRSENLRDYELSVFDEVDYVFARPEVASVLSEINVPLGLLQDSYSRPGSGSPTFDEADFSLTGNRLGYIGYLGFRPNVASLDWFLTGVWPDLQEARPGIELHVVGGAPNEDLQRKLGELDDVYLHWGSNDRKLLDLGCRVVIDPLLYENHVDAKLINSMARSLPVVTTLSATHRAHRDLEDGVVAAATTYEMVKMIDELMSDSVYWKSISDDGREVAEELLPHFEVAHAMRRVLTKLSEAAGEDDDD